MDKKLEELVQLIKKCGSKESLNLKEEMVRCLISILDDAGFNALIILEIPGIGVAMVGNKISEEGASAPLADLFTDYPGLLNRVMVRMVTMKTFGVSQEENNTSAPDETIH